MIPKQLVVLLVLITLSQLCLAQATVFNNDTLDFYLKEYKVKHGEVVFRANTDKPALSRRVARGYSGVVYMHDKASDSVKYLKNARSKRPLSTRYDIRYDTFGYYHFKYEFVVFMRNNCIYYRAVDTFKNVLLQFCNEKDSTVTQKQLFALEFDTQENLSTGFKVTYLGDTTLIINEKRINCFVYMGRDVKQQESGASELVKKMWYVEKSTLLPIVEIRTYSPNGCRYDGKIVNWNLPTCISRVDILYPENITPTLADKLILSSMEGFK